MSQTHEDSGGRSANNTPRWVKVFGLIALIVLLLLIILMLSGGHGPGRHAPPDDAGGSATLPSVLDRAALHLPWP